MSQSVKQRIKHAGHNILRTAAHTSVAEATLQRLADAIGMRTLSEVTLQIVADRITAEILAEPSLQRLAHRILSSGERKKIDEIASVDKGMQILLALKYKELLYHRLPLPSLADVQFRSYSQNGEDGILLYLFSLIGTTNKKVVEICAGDGIECNSANLILNHRWNGLLFDGNEQNVRNGQAFYSAHRDTFWSPPKLVQAWITAENVNALLEDNGCTGEIDLLSLDMDGIDYWIWKALECIRPRVVVLEYNWVWGAERAVTIPYRVDFVNENPAGAPNNEHIYFGGSLPAFVKLGRDKGYRLIGCEGWGFNAFFLRTDVGKDVFDEIEASKCFEIPMQQKARFPGILKLMDPKWNWVEV